ncbi:PWI domain-containing protein [Lipomyces tetrasporus]|uniref:U1 small nuclear ribonucleoprotein component SNU71 n=1 Tax=Lipomyces tetrasporus TaxID=54092 RepID=A0AAD7VT97_9ASCO|nr:PWI domain-containing protein [Lipomyces tetrasporus]KAJ8099925.1 PWI domain-containing protein [Lipomyces tetrasporus]
MSLRPRPESAAETGLLSEADKRRLKTTKYPPEFDETVNLSKVNFPVMKAWIANEISEIAGGDDIVTEYTVSLFEQDDKPQIKAIQIQLEGFLPSSTIAAKFCRRLWNLLLEAQESPSGIPAKLIEQKKIEVQQTRERRSVLEEQRNANDERSAKLDEIRLRERRERDERRDRDERRKMREGERIGKILTDVTDTYVPSYADEKRSPLSFRDRDRGLDGGRERRRESQGLEYKRERELRERDRERRRERDYRSRSGSRDGERRRDRSRDYIRDGSWDDAGETEV